jgi:uncharacterized protein (TIGR03435 family)
VATVTRQALAALLVGVFAAPTLGQGKLEFEVASIRPSSEQTDRVNVGFRATGSQVRVMYMSLKDYVGIAYRVRTGQVEGPDWTGQERFDITAKIPDGASQEQVPEMFQALLADRFKLKVHRESKEVPIYALAIAKSGLKLKESVPDSVAASDGTSRSGTDVAASGSAAGVAVNMGGGAFFQLAGNKIEIKKMTMQALADMLTRFMDRVSKAPTTCRST